jgi:predicted  nucleic acid-binding Zn-ribbon protein
VEIEFEKLTELQRVDLELQQIALFLENTPSQVEDIDKRIAESSQLAATAKEKMAGSQKKRRELEAEVKDLKTQIGKYKRQLNEVKTNKEYTALLKEIEESEKKVDRLEEAFIAEMLLEDDVQKEIKEANAKYAEVRAELTKEKEGIFLKQKKMEERARVLNGRKGELLPTIPAEQVSLYQRIYRKKAGIVLSPVKDDFCSMCHMRIRPQVLNELLAGRKLILCENCGRILYWQEKKAEPEAEAKAE